MRVRFKTQYALDTNNRIAYELVSDEIINRCDEGGDWDEYYNLKLLGYIPISELEIVTDENNIDALDILVSVTNNK